MTSHAQLHGSVLVFGDGEFGAAIHDSLRHAGVVGTNLRMLTENSDIRQDHLLELFRDCDLVVIALARAGYRAMLDVNRAILDLQTPALFVTFEEAAAIVGPLVLANITPCLACRVLSTSSMKTVSDGPILNHDHKAILQVVTDEVLAILSSPPVPRLLYRAVEVRPAGTTELTIGRMAQCTECGGGLLSLSRSENLRVRSLEVRALTELGMSLEVSGARTPYSFAENSSDAYRTVGVVGGGTAGYLTALVLKICRPQLDVTLIESSKIPIIGVGEASTMQLVRFLHNRSLLRRPVVDFYRRVRPTWKLGIRFFWGLPGDYYFNFPFQYGPLLDAHLYDGNINRHCLASMMMSADKSPVVHRGDGSFESLLSTVRFAYHLDNRRFVRYLKEEARAEGVRYIDTEIVDAALSSDGENIERLVTDDGRRLEFDLYVDCSGFRSMLMEKKLRSPFYSYASTLFTDRAIAANAPNGGLIKPYTTAESMDNGWCWNIPFEDADHLGYVHASAFCSEDEALEEMRRKHPGISNPWVVKFRSGRHEHFWKGNVVAIGNAYAFVEPLESTAIHMIVFELVQLVDQFPSSRRDQAVKALLNKRINRVWDDLRWFLSIHYKFNRKFSTPFWKEIHNSCDVSGAEPLLQLYRERAPLSYRPPMFYNVFPDFFLDDHSFDVILLGQQVDARYVAPLVDRETWERRTDVRRSLMKHALPQMQALELMHERPELLHEFVSNPDSWVHLWING